LSQWDQAGPGLDCGELDGKVAPRRDIDVHDHAKFEVTEYHEQHTRPTGKDEKISYSFINETR
jgi:hypothetical protein